MNDNDFVSRGNKSCSSLNLVLESGSILGDLHSVELDYDYKESIFHIEIEQAEGQPVKPFRIPSEVD